MPHCDRNLGVVAEVTRYIAPSFATDIHANLDFITMVFVSAYECTISAVVQHIIVKTCSICLLRIRCLGRLV